MKAYAEMNPHLGIRFGDIIDQKVVMISTEIIGKTKADVNCPPVFHRVLFCWGMTQKLIRRRLSAYDGIRPISRRMEGEREKKFAFLKTVWYNIPADAGGAGSRARSGGSGEPGDPFLRVPPARRRNMERYRSGHNGPDSKSGVRQRTVGSNPTRSAFSFQIRTP